MLIKTRTGRTIHFSERPMHESVRVRIGKKTAGSRTASMLVQGLAKAKSKTKVVS